MVKSLATAMLLSCALFGCGADEVEHTQIIVVVDSDLSVPDELDEIVMDVAGPRGIAQQAIGDLSEIPLPRSLALLRKKGPLSPVEIRVLGRAGGLDVIERRATLSFIAGRTLVLPMHLPRSCIANSCGNQTCTEDGCSDLAVDPNTLDEWSGQEPRLMPTGDAGDEPEDAGVDADTEPPEGDAEAEVEDASDPSDAGREASGDAARDASTSASDGGRDASASDGDAGSCRPMREQCNERDDDCDGTIDDGFDLRSDDANCGRCGNVCTNGRRCCDSMCSRGC